MSKRERRPQRSRGQEDTLLRSLERNPLCPLLQVSPGRKMIQIQEPQVWRKGDIFGGIKVEESIPSPRPGRWEKRESFLSWDI